MRTLLMINGPNLARLGSRRPEIYGRITLPELTERLGSLAADHGWRLAAFQANGEGDIIDFLEARRAADALVLNPGALMMTCWSLCDSLQDYPAPWFEVHLSNVWAREPFRLSSVLAPLAFGVLAGLWIYRYMLAATALMQRGSVA